MNDQNTRDIAVMAKNLIDHHMTDCTVFRENLRNDQKEFRDDLKRVNWQMAMILGGLVILSHSIDWVLAFMGYR